MKNEPRDSYLTTHISRLTSHGSHLPLQKNMTYDILIIGAGAAGLMAMNELVQSGYSVCLLEATDRPGGRIATQINAWGESIETGAEFIHGKTSVTSELLKRASIPYVSAKGKMISVRNSVWLGEEINEIDFKVFSDRLSSLGKDCTIAAFLEDFLPEKEHDEVRIAVRQFAEGFSLADINRASVFAFRKEWTHQQDDQYRIPGGYDQLVQYLLTVGLNINAAIHYGTPVEKIYHSEAGVTVQAHDRQFTAKKLIVTVSAGVLQSGTIKFIPELYEYDACFKALGFGSVVKIMFRFKSAFWHHEDDEIGFLLSDEAVPTWWTQSPSAIPLLTGWLGGPNAFAFSQLDQASQMDRALSSLASILHLDVSFLQQQLLDSKIICWDNNPYTRGGYSYLALDSERAKQVIAQPVNNSIYFAGEAIYEGELQGTVEAALVSGQLVAERIAAKAK